MMPLCDDPENNPIDPPGFERRTPTAQLWYAADIELHEVPALVIVPAGFERGVDIGKLLLATLLVQNIVGKIKNSKFLLTPHSSQVSIR